jgi:uncharacterized BrkB/YihY/UPF0761 family membrane protein
VRFWACVGYESAQQADNVFELLLQCHGNTEPPPPFSYLRKVWLILCFILGRLYCTEGAITVVLDLELVSRNLHNFVWSLFLSVCVSALVFALIAIYLFLPCTLSESDLLLSYLNTKCLAVPSPPLSSHPIPPI